MPNMKLMISIINYLKDQANKESSNADTQESLEVAVQCLQTAYDLDPKDPKINNPSPALEEIFMRHCPLGEDEIDLHEASQAAETLSKAESMKNLGNNLMRENQFKEALRYYTIAIEMDDRNAVYYCNRAAAYSKLNDFENAIKDCKKAVEIDPNYAKAYGRMGLAYGNTEQNDLAIKAFQKALEIEPENENYQSNLKLALEKGDAPGGAAGLAAGLNSVDWQSLFSNPAFRNMASSIMQDPNIINALSAGMSSSLNNMTTSNIGPGGDASASPSASPGGTRSFDMLLEAGQYLAAQMQAANPDLVEQFRQTNSRNPNPDDKDSSAK